MLKHVSRTMPVPPETLVEVILGQGVEAESHIGPAREFAWGDCGPGTIEYYTVLRPSGVGDVTSDKPGSGARFNTGKPAMDLIPLSLIAEARAYAEQHDATLAAPGPVSRSAWVYALHRLGHFQMREDGRDALLHTIGILNSDGKAWGECARVFDYGRAKYAAWNWAKGMAWSIPIACAGRHIEFGVLAGEDDDAESGLPHRGHVLCNIVMLLWFIEHYPEGDDRCPSRYEPTK
jgi:Domain of unknown function (DUF5664)